MAMTILLIEFLEQIISNPALAIIAWSETFDRLEKCCDKCQDVANVVERVIMKNT